MFSGYFRQIQSDHSCWAYVYLMAFSIYDSYLKSLFKKAILTLQVHCAGHLPTKIFVNIALQSALGICIPCHFQFKVCGLCMNGFREKNNKIQACELTNFEFKVYRLKFINVFFFFFFFFWGGGGGGGGAVTKHWPVRSPNSRMIYIIKVIHLKIISYKCMFSICLWNNQGYTQVLEIKELQLWLHYTLISI